MFNPRIKSTNKNFYTNKEIEEIINQYQNKQLHNSYTEICNNIISFYNIKGYLSAKQVYILEKQIKEGKNEINCCPYNKIKNPKGKITLTFDHIPNNCDECPLKVIPGGYGQEYCLFGCSIWGSSIERPEDCPIEILK